MKNILGIHKDLGKEILTLALPTIIENVFQTLVGFLDTLVIARLSLVAVTAVGLANSLLNVYLAVYLAIGVGGTALIARSLGAKQMDKAQVFARQTQDISLVAGFLFGFISFFFGRAILQMMGANQVVFDHRFGRSCGDLGSTGFFQRKSQNLLPRAVLSKDRCHYCGNYCFGAFA